MFRVHDGRGSSAADQTGRDSFYWISKTQIQVNPTLFVSLSSLFSFSFSVCHDSDMLLMISSFTLMTTNRSPSIVDLHTACHTGSGEKYLLSGQQQTCLVFEATRGKIVKEASHPSLF
jgi:hypothetical protein